MAAPLGKKRKNSNMLVTDNLSQLDLKEGPLAIPLTSQCLLLPTHLATSMSVFAYVFGHICFCQCIWPPQYLYLPMHLATSVCFCQVSGHTNVFLHTCLAFSPGHIHDHAESVGHVYPILCHHNIIEHNSTQGLVVKKKIFKKTPVLLYRRYKTSP